MTACRPSTSTMPPIKLAASKLDFLGGAVVGSTVELVWAVVGRVALCGVVGVTALVVVFKGTDVTTVVELVVVGGPTVVELTVQEVALTVVQFVPRASVLFKQRLVNEELFPAAHTTH